MSLIVQNFIPHQPYLPIQSAMRTYACSRAAEAPDRLWLLEHEPVYTLGQAGKPEHILLRNHIPVVQSDRGGQVTYHGPGLLMFYFLLDLKRLDLGVRAFVRALEDWVVDYLKTLGIEASLKPDAPGVYIDGLKIASIGLRVRKYQSYHGICFNVDGDLKPFSAINPCGYRDLRMTRLSDWVSCSVESVKSSLTDTFIKKFGYSNPTFNTQSAVVDGETALW